MTENQLLWDERRNVSSAIHTEKVTDRREAERLRSEIRNKKNQAAAKLAKAASLLPVLVPPFPPPDDAIVAPPPHPLPAPSASTRTRPPSARMLGKKQEELEASTDHQMSSHLECHPPAFSPTCPGSLAPSHPSTMPSSGAASPALIPPIQSHTLLLEEVAARVNDITTVDAMAVQQREGAEQLHDPSSYPSSTTSQYSSRPSSLTPGRSIREVVDARQRKAASPPPAAAEMRSTAGIRWKGCGKDAIIKACLLSLGPNLDPMDVDQVASSSAAAPLAAPPPPSSQQRAAIDRRVCASASAGGKPEHCRGFVVKTEPPSVLLCTGCLDSASRPFSRPVEPLTLPAPRSSVPAAPARPIGPHQAPMFDAARARLSRPRIGDVPSFMQRSSQAISSFPAPDPAQHGPLGSQHWRFWNGEGDSSDEEDDFKNEQVEDLIFDDPFAAVDEI